MLKTTYYHIRSDTVLYPTRIILSIRISGSLNTEKDTMEPVLIGCNVIFGRHKLSQCRRPLLSHI